MTDPASRYATLGIQRDYLDYLGRPAEVPQAVAEQLATILSRHPELAVTDEPTLVVVEGDSPSFQWPTDRLDLITEQGDTHTLSAPFQLEGLVDFGYHRLEDTDGNRAALIYAPRRSYQPPAASAHGGKFWGSAVQLYTLRSEHNWGIGDFADLAAFARSGGAEGMATVGLNPLHLLYNEDASKISPYSPSSRLLLNPLYIALPEVAEFAALADLPQAPWSEDQLAALRATERVDYRTVSAIKFAAFEALFAEFNARASAARQQAFNDWCEQQGFALHQGCLYQALYHHFYRSAEPASGWPDWPAEYHQPDAAAVAQFARDHAERVRFYQFLQWLADQQLAAADAEARNAGMALGLYRDLAVGIDGGGAEAWVNPTAYCREATIGCPPDMMAPGGQGWGLQPFHPLRMAAQGFAPFIELVRSNMRHCGALRLDHIMVLFRLWWIPNHNAALDGGYVHYPLRELVAILALESHRNRCVLIGEDLGTVPPEISRAMDEAGIYSYKVQMFERHQDGSFKPPADYQPHAMAVASTHDLPPLLGFWRGVGISARQQLGLYPRDDMASAAWRECEADRHHIRVALKSVLNADLPDEADPMFERALIWLMYEYLALSRAQIMIVQPEDLLLMSSLVNLPGTSDQFPNWQRKLEASVAAIFDDPWRQQFFARMRQHRSTDAKGYGH